MGAIERGDIAPELLVRFRAELQDVIGPRASFEVLSGEQEARAEWRTVQHELQLRAEAGGFAQDCAGMLSGGGMSSQLAVGPAEFFSIKNQILAPDGLSLRAKRGELRSEELLAALPAVEAYFEAMAEALPQRLAGTYALIEVVAKRIAEDEPEFEYNTLYSHSAILEGMARKIAAFCAKVAKTSAPVDIGITQRIVYSHLVLVLLRRVFDPSATFYMMDHVSWVVGKYLLLAEDRS